MQCAPLHRLHLQFLHFPLIPHRGPRCRSARPTDSPTERATYVFSTRTNGRANLTIYLAGCLSGLVACAALAMLLLCHQIGASPAPCCVPLSLPPSLARSTNREGEKKEGEKELVDQPGDGGALAYLVIGGGGLARVARSGDVYLPKQFVNRREGKKKEARAAPPAAADTYHNKHWPPASAQLKPERAAAEGRRQMQPLPSDGPTDRDSYLPAKQ